LTNKKGAIEMYNDSQDPYRPLFQLSEQWGKPGNAQPPQEELSPWDANSVPVQTWAKSFEQLPSALRHHQRQKWRNMVVILAGIVGTVMLVTAGLLVFALPRSAQNSQTALKTPLSTFTHATPAISVQATPIPTSKPTPVPTSQPIPVLVSKPVSASVSQPMPTVVPTPTHPATSTTQQIVTGGLTVSLNTQSSSANIALNITIQNFANKQFFMNIVDQANGDQVLHQIENTDSTGQNGANTVINAPQGVQALPRAWIASITDTQGHILSSAPVIANGTMGKATF
jgi:hypothetical protein